MTLGWLSLGGNLGDPAQAMAAALRHLDGNGAAVRAVSRLYRTPPWGRLDQPDFLNCCASVETALEPERLLELCLAAERALHRVRTERWGPRTIDIDIVAMEGVARLGDQLVLPHPQAHRRAFVLMPLLELAPDGDLAGRSLAAWLAACDASGIRPVSQDGDWWREG